MKIFFLSIGLMLATATAFATVQSKASPDKPWRIYVKKDTQNFHYNGNGIAYDYYTGLDHNGGHILVGTASGAQDYNHIWRDGVGGGGSWATDHTDSTVSDDPLYTGSDHYHVDGQFSWASTKWPTFTNCTETLTGDTWLLGWADIDVGLDPWQSDQVPLIQNEHCQIVDTKSVWTGTNNYSHYDFNRTADTVWHVQTGGKAVPGLLNLWQFSGSVFVHTNKFAVPPFQGLSSYEITNKPDIVIGSMGNLLINGVRYNLLPNDADFNITPKVSGKDFYTFNVSGNKYLSYFDLYVEQASPGYSFLPYGPNYVGHASYSLSTEAPSDALQYISTNLTAYLNTTWGFFPGTNGSICSNDPGQLESGGANNGANIHRRFYIGFSGLLNGLSVTRGMQLASPAYCVTGFNCVSAARYAGYVSGVHVLPWDQSPQNFGVTLIRMYPPILSNDPFDDGVDIFYSPNLW
jgi:hypothetical protein